MNESNPITSHHITSCERYIVRHTARIVLVSEFWGALINRSVSRSSIDYLSTQSPRTERNETKQFDLVVIPYTSTTIKCTKKQNRTTIHITTTKQAMYISYRIVAYRTTPIFISRINDTTRHDTTKHEPTRSCTILLGPKHDLYVYIQQTIHHQQTTIDDLTRISLVNTFSSNVRYVQSTYLWATVRYRYSCGQLLSL